MSTPPAPRVAADRARAAASLPAVATPLLGREEDVATAERLLADPDVRLLTLTGPGGIGKTRLALELAHRRDGRFVALAAVDDPERVLSAIAQAVGAVEGEGQSPLEALAALLAGGEHLLVIDNFEQVLAAAPDLARLLAATPGTKLVVTSRAALRITGEHELAVAPLAPEPAADLFVRRARALNPRLELGDAEGERIERICERLDGLPLAIELAAARSKLLGPAAILDRLERRLDLLSSGPRDAPERQQTLRATIDWSYDLLDQTAQALFARLGVFAGGWTLESAEAVCGPDALDGLATLVDQSLVAPGGGRFSMLETVREYALERLTADGELDAARSAHAEAFAAFAEVAGRGLHTRDVGAWLDRVHADHENIRTAIGCAAAAGDAPTALRLCAIWRYWVTRGNLTEGRALMAEALAAGDAPPDLRRDALDGAGVLAGEQGDFAAARAQFEAMLALAREHGTPARVARAYSNLGNLALYEGETDEAIRLYEESTALWRGTDDDRGLSVITQNLGIAHSGAGNHERAVELLEESVVLARRAGDPAHVSSALRSLGRASLAGGADGLAIVKEALELSWEVRDRPGIVECLETVATVVEPESGAELIGAAEAIREAAGAARQPDEEAWVAEAMTTLRAALGEAALAAAVQRGRNLTLTAAVTRAIEM